MQIGYLQCVEKKS